MSRHLPIWALLVVLPMYGCGNPTNTQSPKTPAPKAQGPVETKLPEKKVTDLSKGGSPVTKADKPTPVMPNLSKLEFKLPKGWITNYNPVFEGSWVIDNYTKALDGGEFRIRNAIYVRTWDKDMPPAFETFAQKVKDKNYVSYDFTWTEVTTKEKLPDGFLFKGTEKANSGDQQVKPTFVVLRKVGGRYLIFTFGSEKPANEAILGEAISIAKTAQVAPAK